MVNIAISSLQPYKFERFKMFSLSTMDRISQARETDILKFKYQSHYKQDLILF